MSNLHVLPLETALTFLKVSKAELRLHAGISSESIAEMEKRGVSLDGAETIAMAYGYHPSEIWGDSWVDAVLTLSDWTEANND